MIRSFSGPTGTFDAEVTVPGDKSLSHRALIFAAMADGTSDLAGLGPGEDVLATRQALRSLGVTVDGSTVTSKGFDSWRAPAGAIDAGNSGTTIRLLAGALAGRPFPTTIDGDESLRRRPMQRLVGPLGALGASVETTDGCPPIKVHGGALRGAEVELPIASAQVRTAVALAALQAEGPTFIRSPRGFRDHTERRLEHEGLGRWDGDAFVVLPGRPSPVDVQIPSDPSSAAFLWAAAALRPGARITTPNVSLNPGRTGFLDHLRHFGAEVHVEVETMVLGEPVGSVTVVGRPLRGVDVAGEDAVRALDELPLTALIGVVAEGPTMIRDAGELRVKESDRIASTVKMITALGGVAEERPEGMVVHGGATIAGGTVDAAGDHRIAMAAAVAATASVRPVEVGGFGVVGVSWPGFDQALEATWSSP